MFKINVKQLSVLMIVGLFLFSCDDDSNPVLPQDEHTDAEGLQLLINEIVVYEEFEGAYYIDGLESESSALILIDTVNPNEVEVRFLDHDRNPIEHEGHDAENEDELAFDGYNDSVISLNVEEHCDEILGQSECVLSEHCEWDVNESICEDEEHDGGDDGADHEEHHMGFEMTGLTVGSTTFILLLMHDGHADYTSKEISVTVQ